MKKFWKWIKSLFSRKSGPDFKSLEWRFGGFDGSNAREDTSPAGLRVLSAKLENTGMRFEYSGGMWGYDYAHHDARMCLFVPSGKKWVGGFWEWGSLKRNYRDFKNIRQGFKGWDPSLVASARELAFVVTDKTGSRRSNVVVFKR